MFDFDAAVQSPFRMQPGLRRLLPGARQLTPSAPGPGGPGRHLGEKLAVWGAFSHQTLLAQPGFDAKPALAALEALAQAEHPTAWHTTPDDHAHALALGWSVGAGGAVQPCGPGAAEVGRLLQHLPPPQRRPALLSLALAEDFAVLQADGTVPWLAVALPSMWAPEDKLGLHFAAVHAPVADNRLIQAAATSLVALVTDAQRPDRWERFVWTLTGHPRLHAHPHRVPPQRWAPDLLHAAAQGDGPALDALAAQTWLRTERQTFIPVPVANPAAAQAVFTIAIDTCPLPEVVRTPGSAERLLHAVASMSPAVLAYRGLDAASAPLQRWLACQPP